MTLQQVNLGTPPAGSDGDDPRTAFTRINNNFKTIDDTGLTGPVAAIREVANLNDANGPGKWIGTATASNRPPGFARSGVEVLEEPSGDLMQSTTDKASGFIANRIYTASTDTWSTWIIVGQSEAVLPVAKGGTGGTTQETARTGLGLGAAAVESVVPVAKGGTGGTTQETARTGLGLGAAAVESVVPVAKGGTGATNQADARTALGATAVGSSIMTAATPASARATLQLKSAALAEVLGLVSQSSGAPTGAVMEWGFNANGEFYKFASGLMICTVTRTATVSLTTSYGGASFGSASWDYPATFVGTLPVASGTAYATGRILTVVPQAEQQLYASALFVLDFTTNGTSPSVLLKFSAIGRWF